MPARDLRRLTREIAEAKKWCGLPAGAPVRSCYEAGRDGFWLHRYLTAETIDNLVVDSASIEVNRRLRRAKSDRLDARKLVAMLVRYHAGEQKVWSVVRVPTVEEEDRRQLHRELRTLKQERTRVTNRMKGLLANQGIRLPKGQDLGDGFEEVRVWDGSPLPAGLRARLQREWAHAQFLHGKILELERERQRAIEHGRGAAVEKVRQLLRLKAIGPSGAWVYVNEFFGWRRFRNRKEVGAAAGLTPTPYQSGDDSREQGISKAGSRHIRAVAIEMAWCWLRYQPGSRLSRWYQERFARGGARARKVGIVALARKLLVELWRFLEHGVIPDGAELKAY
ncbi:MAG: IS110 family transposase [Candidatus Rokubacteria bacterium]|nr:IS110 family transposase [Candidatus Rokubacteria bacterium]